MRPLKFRSVVTSRKRTHIYEVMRYYALTYSEVSTMPVFLFMWLVQRMKSEL